MLLGYAGWHYRKPFEYPKGSLLKSNNPKNTCQIFLLQNENFKPKKVLPTSPSLEFRSSTPLLEVCVIKCWLVCAAVEVFDNSEPATGMYRQRLVKIKYGGLHLRLCVLLAGLRTGEQSRRRREWIVIGLLTNLMYCI